MFTLAMSSLKDNTVHTSTVTCRSTNYSLYRRNVKMRNLQRIQRRNAKIRNSCWHQGLQHLQYFLDVLVKSIISEIQSNDCYFIFRTIMTILTTMTILTILTTMTTMTYLTALAVVRLSRTARMKTTFILLQLEAN